MKTKLTIILVMTLATLIFAVDQAYEFHVDTGDIPRSSTVGRPTKPENKTYWLYDGDVSVTIPQEDTCTYKMGLFRYNEAVIYDDSKDYILVCLPKHPTMQGLWQGERDHETGFEVTHAMVGYGIALEAN